jgi:micrococcal nuclease
MRTAAKYTFLLVLLGVAGFAAATRVGDAPAAPQAAAASEWFLLRGTVAKVVDGDTIDVRVSPLRRERVRLIGIDTPERGACYSGPASAEARRLALGKRVRLVGDRTQARRDRFRRLLAYVTLPNGKDLGRQLILGGYGSVYVFNRPFNRTASYRAAERAAQGATAGLWASCRTPTTTAGTTTASTTVTGTTTAATTTTATTVSTTTATTTTTTTSASCHASYPDFCIPPPPPDLDCGHIPRKGFRVLPPDPHRFDGDSDGVGCES